MSSKINKSIFIIFFIIITCYLFLMTYFRPLASDDFILTALVQGSFFDIFREYFNSYMTWNPRIGTFFLLFVLFFGKTLFNILNPLIMIFLFFTIHFVIVGKRINIENTKDVFLFILAALLVTFNITGGQTIFWASGATNYAWTALLFFLLIALFRPLLDGRNIISNAIASKIAVFALGFSVGLSNENASPVSILIIAAIIAYFKLKKINIPSWCYWALLGNIVGTIALFIAPGSYIRMSYTNDYSFTDIFKRLRLQETASQYLNSSFIEKLKFMPMRIGKFIIVSAGLPVIIFISSVFCIYKSKTSSSKKTIDKNPLFCAIFLLISLTLASVLCFAPKPSIRAYFLAIVTTQVSLLFFICYFTDNFKKKFLSNSIMIFALLAGLVCSIILVPSFYKMRVIHKKNLITIKNALLTQEKEAVLLPMNIPMKLYHCVEDIKYDKNDSLNNAVAVYYGLSSVSLINDTKAEQL